VVHLLGDDLRSSLHAHWPPLDLPRLPGQIRLGAATKSTSPSSTCSLTNEPGISA
jgi:hypothetical protein